MEVDGAGVPCVPRQASPPHSACLPAFSPGRGCGSWNVKVGGLTTSYPVKRVWNKSRSPQSKFHRRAHF